MSFYIKKIHLYALTALLVFVICCGGTGKKRASSGDEGWVNNNTYVIKTTGSPLSGETSIEKRKKQSLEAAKANARDEIMKRFTYNPRYEEVQFEDPAVQVRIDALGSIVRSGTVLSEEYDSEQNCRITYSVTSKDLKTRIDNFYANRDEVLDESGVTKKTSVDVYPASGTDPFSYLADNQGAFFGNDLYIFKCTGYPGKNEKDAGKRRSQARQAAILMSQYNIIKTVYDRRVELYGGMGNEYDNSLREFHKELTETVKTGTVLSEKFDSQQNCTILYQVKRKGFHKWAYDRK